MYENSNRFLQNVGVRSCDVYWRRTGITRAISEQKKDFLRRELVTSVLTVATNEGQDGVSSFRTEMSCVRLEIARRGAIDGMRSPCSSVTRAASQDLGVRSSGRFAPVLSEIRDTDIFA